MKILELKNITVEIIISVDRFKSTMEETEERIRKLQDRTIEITQSKQQRKNRQKEQKFKDPWDYNKRSNIRVIRVLKRQESVK